MLPGVHKLWYYKLLTEEKFLLFRLLFDFRTTVSKKNLKEAIQSQRTLTEEVLATVQLSVGENDVLDTLPGS